MKAYQDWYKGTLVIKPQERGGRIGKPIVYSMKKGRFRDLEMEALEDEWRT